MINQLSLKAQPVRGFTLTELMIVLLCIAILSCIAYPVYQRHIKKTRLYQAHSVLLYNSKAMGHHYQRKLSYKANSTTWPVLPVQGTEHFCIRFIGNPRGTLDGRYNLKAVAIDANNETRILKMNQDGLTLICQSSTSRCDETTPYFRGGSSVDKECTIFNS